VGIDRCSERMEGTEGLEAMTDGKGCTCHAQGAFECGCNVDWTPQELVDLREKSALLETMLKMKDQTLAGVIEKMEEANRQVALYAGRDKYLYDRIEAYEAIIEDLKSDRDTWKDRAENATAAWEAVIQKHTETLERFAALEKDARILATCVGRRYDLSDVIDRIMGATKGDGE
jgi:hypothetical protein